MSSPPRREGLRSGRRDWLWVVAAVSVVAAGIFVAYALLSGGSDNGEPVDLVAQVECERGERLNYHVHAHLTLIVEGETVPVPGDIGIRPDCLFWLHTHSPNGIIHVEAPEERAFTLGQIFEIWEQPLSSTQLLHKTVDGSHEVQATVNGEPWSGDPAAIPLADLTTIVLEYGPPFVPPPEFDWGQ
ncbi:MAG TPA: hypothetical protein VFP63_00350 [Dehalococcoidia bacterium]|nr:hypothetical protein [Dehalococcoidia bacterium]